MGEESQTVDKARMAAAIRGALLADAASMGTHGIETPEEMAKEVTSTDEPEFKTPPAPKAGYSSADCPGHFEAGMNSPHGEQLLFVTEYCGKHKCVTSGHLSIEMTKWCNTGGGYIDDNLKEFLRCMKQIDRSVELCGGEDLQAHCYARIIPVVCLYAGELDMRERVNDTIRVYQNNTTAIEFGLGAATLLEAILFGSNLKDALEKVVQSAITHGHDKVMDACLRALSEAKSKTLQELVATLKEEDLKSNEFPSAFIIPLYIFYATVANGDINEAAYIKAIRDNIMAAGDTCPRSIFIGAILGACVGDVPGSFVEKYNADAYGRANTAIEQLKELVN